MHDTVQLIAFVIGLVIIAGTIASVFTTLVVPRMSSSRMMRGIARCLAVVARKLMRRFSTYEQRDRLLAMVGPLAMMLLFVLWLVLLVIGFGLMTWWTGNASLAHSVAIAGSSVFTLGVVSGPRPDTESLEFVAAGLGLLVVALEIAYLPTMYAAFSARETEVTLLATRAGTPAWGPEILARHHWFRTSSELPPLYRDWERWAAAVSESHTNYPALMWFRSPVSTRSWLLALVAMMDAAAMQDAVSPGSAPRQARNCLAMGMNCLRSSGRRPTHTVRPRSATRHDPSG